MSKITDKVTACIMTYNSEVPRPLPGGARRTDSPPDRVLVWDNASATDRPRIEGGMARPSYAQP